MHGCTLSAQGVPLLPPAELLGRAGRYIWGWPTACLEGPAHPSAKADSVSACWRLPCPVFSLSLAQINCCLPAVRCFPAPASAEGREPRSHADRGPVLAHLAASTAPSLESHPSAGSSPTAELAPLGRLRRDGPSAWGPWVGPVCVCLSEGFQGLVGASSD